MTTNPPPDNPDYSHYPAPAPDPPTPEQYTESYYPAPEPQPVSPFDSEPDPNRAAIIAGVITSIIVLVLLGYYILANQLEPAAAPPTTTPRPTTTAPAPTTIAPVTGALPGYKPEFERARCEFSLITDVDFECGWLTVPEDRQNPDNGREVQLHVALFESSNPAAPEDPIIYLDGGPGGSTLDPLEFTFAQAWQPLLDDRDLILFDQRGVGFSTPSLDCPEEREWAFSVLDVDMTAEEERVLELRAIEECRDRLIADGVDLAQYNSAENAADVADLRIALELDEVNLLGISYGTRLAATAMRDHPTGIRSVILDSTYTPDVNIISEGPANLDRALRRLWEGCRTDVDCDAHYGNIEERLFALVDKLEAEPTRASVPDFLGGGSWDVLFDGDWVLGTVFQGLYSEQVIPLIPQMIEELEAGETSTLTLLTSNTLANAAFLSLGMHLSVQCNEEVTFTTAADIEAGLEGFDDIADSFDGSSNLGDFMLAACEVWPAGSAAAVENEPVTSAIPTLVLAGEYDPITPPAWGASAAAYIDRATFVEFPGLGHGTSIAGDCPLSIVFEFLNEPATEPATDCVAEMEAIDFKIPGEPPPPLALVPFTEDIAGTTVTGVAPEGWTELTPGTYMRGDSAVDQTAILQQVVPFVGPDQLVNVFANQFNMAQDPEQTSTRESPLGAWQLYRGDAEGFSVDIAALDIGDSTAVILVISDESERDRLLGELLLPAIDAFQTGSIG
jgi:pimeloyl-ACP methyl ester carboxylesterase